MKTSIKRMEKKLKLLSLYEANYYRKDSPSNLANIS